MGPFNNDVIKLIQSIVVKNKIRFCCREYHKTYDLIPKYGREEYCHRKAMNFYAFNYRVFHCFPNCILKLNKSIGSLNYDLPKNYF